MNILLFIVINIVCYFYHLLIYHIILLIITIRKTHMIQKSFYKFLVGEKISFKDLLTGLSFGIIFGFFR